MNTRWFEWNPGAEGADRDLARAIRSWSRKGTPPVSLDEIESDVAERGDLALADLTARFDATDLVGPDLDREVDAGRWMRPDGRTWRMKVEGEALAAALSDLDSELRESLELARENVEVVARAQLGAGQVAPKLAQGQNVTVREVPVRAAGIYVPGGGAAYPSSLIMGVVPAQVAGVERIAVVTPPGANGEPHRVVLAAAALCGVEEVYAIGGAQAVFALARGTASIDPVDTIAGPGNEWVQAAKRAVFGEVGIDSIAGPSELMVIADEGADPGPIALDLCAQAEHGGGGLLVAASPSRALLEGLSDGVAAHVKDRPALAESPLALVETTNLDDAARVAEALAPEHLQVDADRQTDAPDLPGPRSLELAAGLRRPGCLFVGPRSATAFGDYVAGSNHVLPTGGAGRFAGPLGPGVFRRRISQVTLGDQAATDLAPHVARIARAEGLEFHAESALARMAPAQDGAAGGRIRQDERER